MLQSAEGLARAAVQRAQDLVELTAAEMRSPVGWPLPAFGFAVGHALFAYYLWHPLAEARRGTPEEAIAKCASVRCVFQAVGNFPRSTLKRREAPCSRQSQSF